MGKELLPNRMEDLGQPCLKVVIQGVAHLQGLFSFFYKALKIVFGKLITQSAVQDHQRTCQKCRTVGPTPQTY